MIVNDEPDYAWDDIIIIVCLGLVVVGVVVALLFLASAEWGWK